MHEDPQVPNYGEPGKGPLLEEGMVLAIEPMTTAGRPGVRVGGDGWAIYSQDGSLAAHFEFTVAITADGPADPDAVAPAAEQRRARSAPQAAASSSQADRSPLRELLPSGVLPVRASCVREANPRLGSGGRNGSQSRVAGTTPKGIMKVRPSVKPMCEKCKIIRRHGVVLVICQNKRHKQRQG